MLANALPRVVLKPFMREREAIHGQRGYTLRFDCGRQRVGRIEHETVNAKARCLSGKNGIAADAGNFGPHAGCGNGSCTLRTFPLLLSLSILLRGCARCLFSGILLRLRSEWNHDRQRDNFLV